MKNYLINPEKKIVGSLREDDATLVYLNLETYNYRTSNTHFQWCF